MSLKDKIIAFDIDGTLARYNTLPSQYSYEVLRKLNNQGYKITFITGRAIISSINIYREVNSNIPYVCCNGSLLFDPISNKKIIEHNIPLEMVYEIIDNQEIMENVEDMLAEYDFISYSLNGTIFTNATYKGNFKDTIKNNPSTLVIYAKSYEKQLKIKEIIDKMDYDFKYRIWYYQAELYNIHCDKVKGCKDLLDYLHKDFDDLVYFGDATPDKDLIIKAGIGIAMKNAPDEVKQVADYITDYNNEEDGAIKFLEKLIELENE